MQITRFNNGGFVLHRAGPGANISAWYDARGRLLDAERKVATARGLRMCNLRPGSKDWRYLEQVGVRFAE